MSGGGGWAAAGCSRHHHPPPPPTTTHPAAPLRLMMRRQQQPLPACPALGGHRPASPHGNECTSLSRPWGGDRAAPAAARARGLAGSGHHPNGLLAPCRGTARQLAAARLEARIGAGCKIAARRALPVQQSRLACCSCRSRGAGAAWAWPWLSPVRRGRADGLSGVFCAALCACGWLFWRASLGVPVSWRRPGCVCICAMFAACVRVGVVCVFCVSRNVAFRLPELERTIPPQDGAQMAGRGVQGAW